MANFRYLILVLVFTSSAFAGERIMFVGNSLTGFNNLPAQVLEHAREAGFQPEIEEYIAFGQTLAFHLTRKEIVDALASKQWDVVVLQEYSVLPIEKPIEFEESVSKFEKLIHSSPLNAKTKIVLFQNWSRREVDSIEALNQSYDDVATEFGAVVSPIGRAWNEARAVADLYVDERHPSVLGSYLAAAMMLKTLFGVKADSLSHRGSESTTSGVVKGTLESAVFYDLDRDVDPAVVEKIQDIVDRTN